MAFRQSELKFAPGIYGNRSKRASRGRCVDGNLIRFPDGVPQQIGGWTAPPITNAPVAGRARAMNAWRPSNQSGRLGIIGTHSKAYKFDGGSVVDITPTGLTVGREDSILGAGWGAGNYGAGAYGTARSSTGITLAAATWTLDLFGNVAIGCYSGTGVIYEYVDAGGAIMAPVTNAPSANAIVVSDERHVFALAARGDPYRVEWSHREDRTVWTPATTNRAGGYSMQATSQFQCGKRCRGLVLAWTQTELFAFAPVANSTVYARDRLGTNCGVMGPNSAAVITDQGGEVAYWFGRESFYAYDGLVRRLDCDLQDYVFEDLNMVQRVKFYAATNSLFSEVWFFYCSSASNEIDRAVVFNYRNGTWSKAGLARLAWLDVGIFALPLAIDASGNIYQHEDGESANGAAMGSYWLSAPVTVGAGERFAEIEAFFPDMDPASGACDLSVIARDHPGAADVVYGPYAFSPSTERVDLAIAANQLQFKVAGSAAAFWEIGAPRISLQGGDGR